MTSERAEYTVRLDDSEYSHSNHEQAALLGEEQIHSPLSQEEEDQDHAREVSSWRKLPWWRRPSPYWSVMAYVRVAFT